MERQINIALSCQKEAISLQIEGKGDNLRKDHVYHAYSFLSFCQSLSDLLFFLQLPCPAKWAQKP